MQEPKAASVGEPVVWRLTTGVAVSGNTLTKNVAIGWGNSGAISTKALMAGDGWVEFTTQETDKRRMLGLSFSNHDNAWEDIDFAIYPHAALYVYESGMGQPVTTPYQVGDTLRVAVVGGVAALWRAPSPIGSFTSRDIVRR